MHLHIRHARYDAAANGIEFLAEDPLGHRAVFLVDRRALGDATGQYGPRQLLRAFQRQSTPIAVAAALNFRRAMQTERFHLKPPAG